MVRNSCTPTQTTKIYYTTAETFLTAHPVESAEQNPMSTKHRSVLLTHPPSITLAVAKLNLRLGFTTTTSNPSITEIKQTLQNFSKQCGNIKTKELNCA